MPKPRRGIPSSNRTRRDAECWKSTRTASGSGSSSRNGNGRRTSLPWSGTPPPSLATRRFLTANPITTGRRGFFDGVQDVSSEDMRKLWARILSGEVEEPGRTTLRTLDILKNMTKEDARVFRDICNYVIDDFVFYPQEFQTGHPKLSFNNIIHLQNAGLLHASSRLAKKLIFEEQRNYILILYQECIFKITASNRQNNIQVPQVLLTSSGKELHRIVECAPDGKYLHSFAKFLQEKNVN